MTKILVIEDEQLIRKQLLSILSSEGFEVIEAADGTAGVQMAQTQMPDLILCDINMPDMDGYEVLATLQQTPATVAIPFIFLSANSDRADIRRGITFGADDYLTKPFKTQELLEAIAARLKKQALLRQRLDRLMEEVERFKEAIEAKDNLLVNLERELRRPMSNVNLALKMLEGENSPEKREHYLKILRDEFAREIALLNQASELQKLLSPENIRLLTQFQLLKQ